MVIHEKLKFVDLKLDLTMVLRSGKRRSLTKVTDQEVKVKKGKGAENSKKTFESDQEEHLEQVEVEHDKEVAEDHVSDDDEGPEDVAFEEAKRVTLQERQKERDQIIKDKERRKEKRKIKLDKIREEKNKKRDKKIKDQQLPMEVLEKAEQEEKVKLNKIKHFDEEEEEDDEISLDVNQLGKGANQSIGAVTLQESSKLHSVPDSVANFKREMLFGSRIRREDQSQVLRRQDKIKMCGLDQLAKL